MLKVSPPESEFPKLNPPLTAGEQKVFNFFKRSLPAGWEIYLRAHLNGLRPDIVLLHPERGVAVYEVKDWDFKATTFSIKKREDGLSSVVGTNESKEHAVPNPFTKVRRYKDEIFNLYCPRLQRQTGLGAITAGVIFPFATKAQLTAAFGEYPSTLPGPSHLHPVADAAHLAEGKLEFLLPRHASVDKRMSATLAADLRSWLVEPDFSAEQRVKLESLLDASQKALVLTKEPVGFRRLRGAAGSGKSLVLAARAAELASRGKDVMVVTFNITLINYLQDLAVRWVGGAARRRITWLNFHQWCKRVAEDLERPTFSLDLGQYRLCSEC